MDGKTDEESQTHGPVLLAQASNKQKKYLIWKLFCALSP